MKSVVRMIVTGINEILAVKIVMGIVIYEK